MILSFQLAQQTNMFIFLSLCQLMREAGYFTKPIPQVHRQSSWGSFNIQAFDWSLRILLELSFRLLHTPLDECRSETSATIVGVGREC